MPTYMKLILTSFATESAINNSSWSMMMIMMMTMMMMILTSFATESATSNSSWSMMIIMRMLFVFKNLFLGETLATGGIGLGGPMS